MQAGIMPARLPDSMPMLPMCHSAGSVTDHVTATPGAAADLLSQCTTEWSRRFIASIAVVPRPAKYTAALTADLSQPEANTVSAYSSPNTFRIPSSPARFNLQNDSASSSLSTSPIESPVSDDPGDGGPGDLTSDCRLRKVASCAVTARERSYRRKRVQFADEVGLALIRVKFLSEPGHVALGHCSGASSSEVVTPDGTQPDCGMHLKCKFPQPSSKYIVFREAVERNCVSLSLVHLDFATIRGAVAVKNTGFRKQVFARISFDSWRSFRDVEAAYNGSEGQQDSFVFSVQCPSDQVVDVQFCVCFKSESGTHWDSNGGENYRIAVCKAGNSSAGYTRDFKPNFASVTEFSEFSAWEHFTDRVYY